MSWYRRSPDDAVRVSSPLCKSRSMSFETAPRVRPVNAAILLGDVLSLLSYISLSITHSATVTPLSDNFCANV